MKEMASSRKKGQLSTTQSSYQINRHSTDANRDNDFPFKKCFILIMPSWSLLNFFYLIIITLIIVSCCFQNVFGNPLDPSLESSPNDGAKSIEATGSSSISSTTVTDIRKLLEDYIQYLASLPDIRKEIINTNKHHGEQQQGRQDEIISAAESNEQIVHPTITYHTFMPIKNQHHHPIIEADTNVKLDSDIEEQENVDNNHDDRKKNESLVPNDYHIESEISLNNEELNSFLENVLASIKVDDKTNATTMLPLQLFEHPDNIANNDNSSNEYFTEEPFASNNNLNDDDQSKTSFQNNILINDDYSNASLEKITEKYTESNIFLDRSGILEAADDETDSINDNNKDNILHLDNENKNNSSVIKESHFNERNMTTFQEQLISPLIIEERIDLINRSDNGLENRMNNFHSDNEDGDSDRFPKEISIINNNDLVEQLKRTKELLNIQIEKLKSLERNVFSKKSVYELSREGITNAPEIKEIIDPNQNTESSLFMTTDNNGIDNGKNPISLSDEQPNELLNKSFQMLTTTIDYSLTITNESTTLPYITGNVDEYNDFKTTTENADESSETATTIVPMSHEETFIDKDIYSENYTKSILENKMDSNVSDSIILNDQSNVEKEDFIASSVLVNSNDTNYDSQLAHIGTLTTSRPELEYHLSWAKMPDSTSITNSSSNTSFNEPNSVSILSANGLNPHKNNYYESNQSGDQDDSNLIITSNNGNNNDMNQSKNESNVETMILTHVPKITIIQKIMKPFQMIRNDQIGSNKNDVDDDDDDAVDSTNDKDRFNSIVRLNKKNYNDENIYKEALRRHQDLIRTTMSSMSLYPAAFKQYKINRNNKVNSVGEIYLLPNFFTTGNNSITSSSNSKIEIDNNREIQNNNNDKINLAFDLASRNDDETSIEDNNNDNNNKNNKNKETIRNKEKISNDNKNEENKLLHLTTYGIKNNNKNKFNTPNVFEFELSRPKNDSLGKKKKLRTKLLLNYHTILSFNRNPENILKLYRPRFKHRKRFRKIRLPIGYRLKKDNASALLNMTTTRNNTFDGNIQNISEVYSTTLEPEISSFKIEENNDEQSLNSSARQLIVEDSVMKDEKISNNTIIENLVNGNNSNFKIFCTFDGHRSLPSTLKDKVRFFDINQLEQNSFILKHCTHLIYAFANVDLNGELYTGMSIIHQDVNLRTRSKDYNQVNLVRIQNLKKHYPHLRILVAIGGWDTPPQLFSLMVASTKLRVRLSLNIHKFILEHGFDGAIIAWFYPVYGMKSTLDSRSTRATGQSLFQLDDKQNLIKFARSLKNRFESVGSEKLELGIMVPPFQEFIDRGYDAKKLAESVDHLILMTYDYYGSWENQVQHFAPLYAKNNSLDERNEKFNINYTVNYWINEKGAPRNQTSIGVAFYGRSFTLANQSDTQVGSLAIGPGIPGPLTNRPGLLAFNELCELYLGNPDVRLSEDEYRITANLQLFDQWIGFDDELSLYLKTKYAIGNHLSGIFIWSINYDDYRNRCGWGSFPLLKSLSKAVEHCTLWKQCSPMIMRHNISVNNSSLL